MPSLVSQSEVDVFTGDFQNLFDTFKRPIIVWKEPKKTFTTIENNVYVGYGAESVKTNVSYTPQSGVFQAMIRYTDKQKAEYLEPLQIMELAGDCRIKVEQPARDYIKQGKTEKIVIDGKSFNVQTDEAVKYFFGVRLYVFHLKATR